MKFEYTITKNSHYYRVNIFNNVIFEESNEAQKRDIYFKQYYINTIFSISYSIIELFQALLLKSINNNQTLSLSPPPLLFLHEISQNLLQKKFPLFPFCIKKNVKIEFLFFEQI